MQAGKLKLLERAAAGTPRLSRVQDHVRRVSLLRTVKHE